MGLELNPVVVVCEFASRNSYAGLTQNTKSRSADVSALPVFQLMLIAISIVLLQSAFCFHPRPSSQSSRCPLLPLYGFKSFGDFSWGSNFKSREIDELKHSLSVTIDGLDRKNKNGIGASNEKRMEINELVQLLEAINPTRNPSGSDLMEGFWRMVYTDFDPPGPSAGKLGPFIGDVFQKLEPKKGLIRNILRVELPFFRISGGLVARQSIQDSQTWRIEFLYVENSVLSFKTKKEFPPKEQIRLWKITYLDDDLRILRAGREDSEESFLFICTRDQDSEML
jgi:hypothetical protein